MINTPTFADLGLSAQTIQAIENKGFIHPTGIQATCIPLLLKDRVDVIGQAQTGTGKTAAFGLPILELVEERLNAVQALILAPTRELALQSAEEILSLKGGRNLEIAAVYGGAAIVNQLHQLKKGVHVVVGTPGRILDHLRRGSLVLDQLKFLVLDEADEMLDMGFLEEIEAIMARTPKEKRTLCFSATMPDPIRRLAERYMDKPQVVRIADETLTTDLTRQLFVEVRESDKFEALTRFIDIEEKFYGIVFCRTKLQCDEVGQKLIARGYHAEALHGDLSQKQRESILNRMRTRQLAIIVATDVAARGIDISALTHVINYNLPEDPEVYIHRIGRTGRAGKQGVAITFVAQREFKRLQFIRRTIQSDIQRTTIPPIEAIIETKRKQIVERLKNLEEPNDSFLDLALDVAGSKLPETVLASVLANLYKEILDPTRYRTIEELGKPPRNEYTRLFIARGRRDGLDKRNLVDYLVSRVGAEYRDIQEVTIQDDHSYISAPNQIAEQILTAFAKTSGPAIISRAKPDNPNGKNLSVRRKGERNRNQRSYRKNRSRR
ncbi:MAG: DEAD/DEAH box helicase [Sphaerochaeta sp.]|nr:MAG: DEAD/DEAH box helicase [Sphaerochaeta sp.]